MTLPFNSPENLTEEELERVMDQAAGVVRLRIAAERLGYAPEKLERQCQQAYQRGAALSPARHLMENQG